MKSSLFWGDLEHTQKDVRARFEAVCMLKTNTLQAKSVSLWSYQQYWNCSLWIEINRTAFVRPTLCISQEQVWSFQSIFVRFTIPNVWLKLAPQPETQYVGINCLISANEICVSSLANECRWRIKINCSSLNKGLSKISKNPVSSSLLRSRLLDVTQVAWHPKDGCEGD